MFSPVFAKSLLPWQGEKVADRPDEGLFAGSDFIKYLTALDAGGRYCWSTNLSCDGLEPGNYLVAFTYIPKPTKNDTGVDLFEGKYQDPRMNDFKLTVVKGVPQEAVNYDLTSE